MRRRIGVFVVSLWIAVAAWVSGAAITTAAAGDGSLSDSNIQYFGRWDKSSITVYKSYWGGAYLKVNFTGTTLKLKLAAPANLYANIDNAGDTYYPGANGTVNLTPTPLTPGVHSLRVATRAESDVLQFQGLVLDSGASTQVPSANGPIVEFVGDSITAGYQNTKWALSDYAWLAAEQIHAEHVQVAYGGICLVDNVTCWSPNAIGMSRQFFKLQTVDYPTSPDWDFNAYQPGAVVINLGSNDQGVGVSDSSFQSAYTTFLQNIRAKYAMAELLVLRPFSGAKAAPAQAAVNARIAAGDAKVHYIDTTGWLGAGDFQADGVHPSDSGQLKAANLLAPILQTYLSKQTILTTQTPAAYYNDARFELGTKFKAGAAGKVTKVRIYANALEGGDHTVRIWKAADGTVAAGPYTWTLTAGTAGWKEFALPAALSIAPNADYIVSVSNSTDKVYPATIHGFDAPILNGNLITYIGSGVYSTTLGAMPTGNYSNSNYFRDVVFIPEVGSTSTHVGLDTVGSNSYTSPANYFIANKAVAGSNVTVNKLNLYVASGATGSARLGIYSDSAGHPGTLLAQTSAITLANGWNTGAIPATSLTAGTPYWLVYNLSATGSVLKGNTAAGGDQYYPSAYGSLPATAPGGLVTDNDSISIYASN